MLRIAHYIFREEVDRQAAAYEGRNQTHDQLLILAPYFRKAGEYPRRST